MPGKPRWMITISGLMSVPLPGLLTRHRPHLEQAAHIGVYLLMPKDPSGETVGNRGYHRGASASPLMETSTDRKVPSSRCSSVESLNGPGCLTLTMKTTSALPCAGTAIGC
jgi:hypothetical protein